MDERIVYLMRKHCFVFKARMYNEIYHTYFGCANCRELCHAYGFEEGMSISFYVGTFRGFDEDMIPIFPPCECDFLKKKNLK